MPQHPDTAAPEELKKLVAIASDLDLDSELRLKANQHIGTIPTHEAFIALLSLAGNERLLYKERDLALKQARDILKKTASQ